MSDEAAQQGDEADEAGASDGASKMVSVAPSAIVSLAAKIATNLGTGS